MRDMQQVSVPYWRRTPPAAFPPIMGLFGLALAWRRASEDLAITEAVSDLVLGAATLLFLFAAGSYLAKTLARPGVLAEEIRILPGLAGVSAMTLSGVLMAAGLVPFLPGLARVALVVFTILHAGLALLAVMWFLRCPPESRRVAPTWHLTFIGFILVPFAAVPLGMTALAQVCFWGPIPVIIAIYAASIRQMTREGTPPPLRPLLVIHMAPFGVQATVAASLDMAGLAQVLAAGGVTILVLFLLRLKWLTEAGFSPFWGAFTFPLAAIASACIMVSEGGGLFAWIGLAVLVSATVVVPAIAVKVMQAWARGALPVKTNAAVA